VIPTESSQRLVEDVDGAADEGWREGLELRVKELLDVNLAQVASVDIAQGWDCKSPKDYGPETGFTKRRFLVST
jgi:hypothetical protein